MCNKMKKLLKKIQIIKSKSAINSKKKKSIDAITQLFVLINISQFQYCISFQSDKKWKWNSIRLDRLFASWKNKSYGILWRSCAFKSFPMIGVSLGIFIFNIHIAGIERIWLKLIGIKIAKFYRLRWNSILKNKS